MSSTGQGAISIRKADLDASKPIAIGFKSLVFAHKATAGATGINLSSLTVPTEMSSIGFSQPTSTELNAASLLFNRKNLTLISSLRGTLVDYLSYSVATSTQINFNGFTAAAGEIFIGIVDPQPTTGVKMVDASALVSNGVLTAGQTDYNVGSPFEVNKYPTTQIGNVLVYVDGVLQHRNTGNATATPSADGNYQEIDNGSGLGSVIKFNSTTLYDRNIIVVSNGLLVNKPTDSQNAVIESLAGQIDAMIPVLADAAGVPQNTFQAAPNYVDLKSFGDNVGKLQRYRLLSTAGGTQLAVGPVDLIVADTTGGAFTINLPASPNVGDRVVIMDAAGTFATSNLTVGRNGNNILSNAGNYILNVNNAWVELIYVSASRGWIVRS